MMERSANAKPCMHSKIKFLLVALSLSGGLLVTAANCQYDATVSSSPSPSSREPYGAPVPPPLPPSSGESYYRGVPPPLPPSSGESYYRGVPPPLPPSSGESYYRGVLHPSSRVQQKVVKVCMGNGGGPSCAVGADAVYNCTTYKGIGGGSQLTADTLAEWFCQYNDNGTMLVAPHKVIPIYNVDGGECGWTMFQVTCNP
jgi:hypothetical protein